MDSKIGNINYDSLAARFISDKKLSFIIIQNISFVEKYLDAIEEMFSDDAEKAIVYRELGSIVYSCVEALLKSALFEINKRCRKRKCKNSCKYRLCKSIPSINHIHTIDSLIFLIDARLLGFVPQQIHELRELNELRNYVHISKSIGGSNKSACFNIEYVEKMLDYYYEILGQLDLDDFYFNENDMCLRELDGNDIDCTEQYTKNGIKTFYTYKLLMIIDKLFFKKEMSKDDDFIIKTVNNNQYYDINAIAQYIKKEQLYSWRYCKTQKEVEILKKKVINYIAISKDIRESILKAVGQH